MSALVAGLACAVLLLAVLLAISRGDLRDLEDRNVVLREQLGLLRDRINAAQQTATPPLPRPLPRRTPRHGDLPLTEHEAQQWADILNHLEQQ